MEGEDENVETGVGQEEGEEFHGVVESLMGLRRSTVVEISNEVPAGWIEVPVRRSPRNVQKQTGVDSSTSPVRKKPRFQSPTSNRFAVLSPFALAGGRRLRLRKDNRRINSVGESTSEEEEEEEEEDEEEVQLDLSLHVRGGRGGKRKGSAGKGSKGSKGSKRSKGSKGGKGDDEGSGLGRGLSQSEVPAEEEQRQQPELRNDRGETSSQQGRRVLRDLDGDVAEEVNDEGAPEVARDDLTFAQLRRAAQGNPEPRNGTGGEFPFKCFGPGCGIKALYLQELTLSSLLHRMCAV